MTQEAVHVDYQYAVEVRDAGFIVRESWEFRLAKADEEPTTWKDFEAAYRVAEAVVDMYARLGVSTQARVRKRPVSTFIGEWIDDMQDSLKNPDLECSLGETQQ
jgi:hypothetical protein